MHEMGMALEIIEIAAASVPSNLKNSKIKKVNVQIGKLSVISPENLNFCFDIASKNTAISGAVLCIEVIPVVIKCKNCKTETTIEEPIFRCVHCGGIFLEVLSGKELDIHSIEIEDKE